MSVTADDRDSLDVERRFVARNDRDDALPGDRHIGIDVLVEGVKAAFTVENVVALTATQHVVTGAAEDVVDEARAVESVVAIKAAQQHFDSPAPRVDQVRPRAADNVEALDVATVLDAEHRRT